MGVFKFLGRLSKKDKAIHDQFTDIAKKSMEIVIYRGRKEIGIIAPRVRISVWIPRENGEMSQIEHEFKVDIAQYEEAYLATEESEKE